MKGFFHSSPVIPMKEALPQLAMLTILLHRHSGPDPWFDRLTTLGKVEGESSFVSRRYISGCRIS